MTNLRPTRNLSALRDQASYDPVCCRRSSPRIILQQTGSYDAWSRSAERFLVGLRFVILHCDSLLPLLNNLMSLLFTCIKLSPFAWSSPWQLSKDFRLGTLRVWVVRLLDCSFRLPILVHHHEPCDFSLIHPRRLGLLQITMLTWFVHCPGIFGQFDQFSIRTTTNMVLLLWFRNMMTCIVRTDDMVSVGMISATFDEGKLNTIHGYLMSRVVRAGYSLLKGTQSHFEANLRFDLSINLSTIFSCRSDSSLICL